MRLICLILRILAAGWVLFGCLDIVGFAFSMSGAAVCRYGSMGQKGFWVMAIAVETAFIVVTALLYWAYRALWPSVKAITMIVTGGALAIPTLLVAFQLYRSACESQQSNALERAFAVEPLTPTISIVVLVAFVTIVKAAPARSFLGAFARSTDFRGRSTRAEFWWFVLFSMVIATLGLIELMSGAISIFGILGSVHVASDAAARAQAQFTVYAGASFLASYALVTALPALALTVRRLRDAGLVRLRSAFVAGAISLVAIVATAWLLLRSAPAKRIVAYQGNAAGTLIVFGDFRRHYAASAMMELPGNTTPAARSIALVLADDKDNGLVEAGLSREPRSGNRLVAFVAYSSQAHGDGGQELGSVPEGPHELELTGDGQRVTFVLDGRDLYRFSRGTFLSRAARQYFAFAAETATQNAVASGAMWDLTAQGDEDRAPVALHPVCTFSGRGMYLVRDQDRWVAAGTFAPSAASSYTGC